MKVKIGKYPSRLTCNICTNYMNKKDGYVDWPTEYTRFEMMLDRIEDKVQDLYNIFNRLWFDRKQQNVSVRIDYWDTWSMDETLGHIVLPMLKQLNKQGAPHVDNNDVPVELQSAEPTDELWFERWDWVLNEMIFAFESKAGENKDWEDKYHTGVMDIVSVPVDAEGNEVDADGAKYFRWDKGPNDTSYFDAKGHRAEAERIQNGFRLFGKYYQNLWE